MIAVDFPQANAWTRPASPTLQPTPFALHNGAVVTCLKPTEEELAAIMAGSPVWVMQAPHGIYVGTISPFMPVSKF